MADLEEGSARATAGKEGLQRFGPIIKRVQRREPFRLRSALQPTIGSDEDERFLHFAFDYNRHDVIYWKIEIPPAG